jgi:DNA-binding CsgD family transcriptional regulator
VLPDSPTASGLARRAHHLDLAAAGPDPAVAVALLSAAAAMSADGAPEAAGELYARAGRHQPDPDDAAACYVDAAECLFDSAERGDAPRAMAVLELADQLAVAPDLRLRVVRAWARLERTTRASTLAIQRLDRYAAGIEADDPERAVHALLIGAFLRAELGSSDLLDQARRCALMAPPESGPLGMAAQVVLAVAEAWAGEGKCVARVVPYLDELCSLLDAGLVEAANLAQLAFIGLVFADEFDRAEALLERALATTRRLGRRRMEQGLLNLEIELCWRRGEWRRGRALSGLQCEESAADFNPTQGFRARLAATVGDDATLAECVGAVDVQNPQHATFNRALVPHAQCLVALAAGDLVAAAEHVRDSRRVLRQARIRHPGFWWHADAIEALLGAGARAEAEELHAELAATVDLDGRWATGALARTTALLWPDRADTGACWEQALEVFARIPAPFERARTLRLRARWREARGDGGGAAADDRAADVVFTHLGALPWISVSDDPPEMSPLDVLTAAELRVAMQVVEGRSNKEIAAECFLSPRTVESHLGSTYRKLGIRSRTELVRLAAPAITG